jgi:hypothetical protein
LVARWPVRSSGGAPVGEDALDGIRVVWSDRGAHAVSNVDHKRQLLLGRSASRFHQWTKSPEPQIRHRRTLFTPVKGSLSTPLIEL